MTEQKEECKHESTIPLFSTEGNRAASVYKGEECNDCGMFISRLRASIETDKGSVDGVTTNNSEISSSVVEPKTLLGLSVVLDASVPVGTIRICSETEGKLKSLVEIEPVDTPPIDRDMPEWVSYWIAEHRRMSSSLTDVSMTNDVVVWLADQLSARDAKIEALNGMVENLLRASAKLEPLHDYVEKHRIGAPGLSVIKTVIGDAENLRSKLASAQEDSKRIDWIGTPDLSQVEIDHTGEGVLLTVATWDDYAQYFRRDTLREAIDKAMQSSAEGK